MTTDERWAARAAELPEEDRRRREHGFWRKLVDGGRWRSVVDAGCGNGFHLKVLKSLGVSAVGFDRSLSALAAAPPAVVAGDLASPPIRAGTADAVLCLGNTLSLLPDRPSQRRVFQSLVSLVRPGGQLLVQGEDAGALVATGPLLRSRALADGRIHLRVFVPVGRRVVMAAGVVDPGQEAVGATAPLLPTAQSVLQRLGYRTGLIPMPVPEPPSSSPATWWLLWRKPVGGEEAGHENG